MLNVTAHPEGDAAAVLIRAAEPLEGLPEMHRRRNTIAPGNLLSGPGKLCQAFGLNASHNGLHLFDADAPLRIEPAEAPLPKSGILAGPRIGISQGQELPWRYVDATRLQWVSRPRPKVTTSELE